MRHSIVVGIDGTEGGFDALRLAETLAAPDTTLYLACVHPYMATTSRIGAATFGAFMRADAERFLERACQESTRRLRLAAHAIPGRSVAEGLQDVVEDEDADLLVIGTSRGGGAGRRFPGPATEGIIAGSVCPVAVAPRGYARQAVAATREVLVAFDGSHEATAALAHAAALAAEASARLSVINVVRSPSRSSVSLVGSALAEVGATAAVEIAGGDPASEIVARTARVDLLVMGSRGRGAIRRPALGTVVSQVVRDAASPVLVLPQSAVLEGAGRAFETTAGTR